MTSFARRHAVNIGLVALAVVLAAVVFVTWSGVTTTEKEARELNVLAAFREDDITRIEIQAKQRQKLVVERGADDGGDRPWFIVEPLREEADPAAMLELLGAFEFARWTRRIKAEEVNRAAFGLDAPERTIVLYMGAIRYRLSIGKEAASPRGARYLEVSGEGAPSPGVMTISRELSAQLDVEADELRERLLTPYLASTLRSMSIEGEGGPRKLRRADWGGWRFEGMLGDVRVDREGLDKILAQLGRTKAESFIDAKIAERAQAGASLVTITMVPQDAKKPTGVIAVGGKCPTSEGALVVLRRQPDALAACGSQTIWPGLTLPADQLVDRKVFSAAEDQVEAVLVVRGGSELELQRKGEGFVLKKPHQAEVDATAGGQRLAALLRASGRLVENPDRKSLGLDPPQGRVVLTHLLDEGTKAVQQVVHIGAASADGRLHVLRQQDGAVLELGVDEARLFVADASVLRSLRLFSFAPTDVRSIEIRRDGSRQKLLRQLSGAFELEHPKEFTPDGNLASDLVDTLASLSADRRVADRDDGSFGLARPRLRIHIELEAGDGSKNTLDLVVGELTAGGAFGQIAGDPGVFVLPKSSLDVLEMLVFDRSVLIVEPAETDRIRIKAAHRSIELQKRGESFEHTDATNALTPARIQQIVDALTTLRAEAAVHTGPALPSQGLSQPALVVEAGKKRIRIGAGDAWRGMSVYYARADDVDATYVVARSKVQQILDAL